MVGVDCVAVGVSVGTGVAEDEGVGETALVGTAGKLLLLQAPPTTAASIHMASDLKWPRIKFPRKRLEE
jgi:hypothetical protein